MGERDSQPALEGVIEAVLEKEYLNLNDKLYYNKGQFPFVVYNLYISYI